MIDLRNVYKEFRCWFIMSLENKRGQSNMISKVVGGIFAIFIIFVVIFTVMNIGNGFGAAITAGFDETSDLFLNVFGPLFTALLGADGEENAFLMILTFILVAIIVVGTLDSVNIFGETRQGGLINLAIGMITAIIGVRFMPQDMWGALTAPSSAFVATILVAIPFGAMFFVSMKVKSNFARKLIWIFYVIFMSYLIFAPSVSITGTTQAEGLSGFMIVYVIFLILGGIMAFFDASVIKFFYKEKNEAALQKKIGQVSLVDRHRLTKKLEEAKRIWDEAPSASEEKKKARIYYAGLKTQLREMDELN